LNYALNNMYKNIVKILEFTNPSCPLILETSSGQGTETLHEYKQIIHNMVQVLFSKELFHDNANIDGKPSYYIEVIGRILEVNTTLEQIPISLSSYRNIVSSQCANNNMGVHTELMSPLEYSKWLHEIICQ